MHQNQLAALLALLLFRSLPVGLYLVVTLGQQTGRRLVLLALIALVAWGSHRLGGDAEALAAAALAYAWFALVSAGLLLFRPRPRGGGLRALGLLVPLFALFLGVPMAALALVQRVHPLGVQVAPAIASLGWGLALSACSLLVDHADAERGPPLGEGLFFLLVNPVVVFAERGRRVAVPGLDLRAGARLLFGLATLALRAVFIGQLLSPFGIRVEAPAAPLHRQYLEFVEMQGRLVLALYASHSGLASVQIGLLRLVGWELPERYRYPFLSTSPQEFWQRWNTWVGHWAERYLFWPVTLRLARLHVPRGLLGGLSVLVTFGCVGLLHDVGAVASRRSSAAALGGPLGMTLVFLCFGALVAAWRAAERALLRLPRPSVPVRLAARAAAWLLLAHLLLAMGALAFPALYGAPRP